MEREHIDIVDYLSIVAVKNGDRVKRYEISPIETEGFYRISENRIETGKVYFPGSWGLDAILADIRRVETN